MCLYDPKDANNLLNKKKMPIRCYKVFKVLKEEDEKIIHSPVYHETTWEVGRTRRTSDEWNTVSYPVFDMYGRIWGGVFHSYARLEGAKKHVDAYTEYCMDNERYVIYRCEIPKDSQYLYQGKTYIQTHPVKSYASQSLKVLREVKYTPHVKQ